MESDMSNDDDKVRGVVMTNWERSGRPRWDTTRTMRETEDADAVLETRGLNPAPTFRTRRRAGDQDYVEKWVRGCKFPWLNPR